MSQAAVEQILGRLLTDADFRDRFFSGPFDFLLQYYNLTPTERKALVSARETLNKKQFETGEANLDPAICRAEIHNSRTPDPAQARLRH